MAVALNKLSRWAVEVAMDEFVRIGREAFLQKYHFGPAKEFFVIHPSTGLYALRTSLGAKLRS